MNAATPLLAQSAYEPTQLALAFGPLGLVGVFQLAGWTLKLSRTGRREDSTLEDFLHRTRGWWYVAAFFALGMIGGQPGVAALMALVCALALRELFAASAPNTADAGIERVLVFVVTPTLHFVAAFAPAWTWQIWIPVATLLAVPIALAARGDCTDFAARAGRLLFSWLLVGWLPVFATALVAGEHAMFGRQAVAHYFFVLFIVEFSDVLQYLWGKTLGRTPILPKVSPKKTWEGLIGGVGTSALIGGAIAPVAELSRPGGMILATACVLAGFFGGAVMSGIKRGLALKDYGRSLGGIGGVLDRIDSLCFAAPVAYALLLVLR